MNEVPLGVILTAGGGTRLQPLTPGVPKPLIPLLNRPLLSYAFDLCLSLSLLETTVVVGGAHDGVAETAIRLCPSGMDVSVAVQTEPRGPGDALASVGDRLEGRQVVVIAVDTLISGSLRTHLSSFQDSGALAWLPLQDTDRPHEMGIAMLDGDRIVHLEEKPERPRSTLAVVGVWMLSSAAVNRVLTDPVINGRGESDLTATVAKLVSEGADVRGGTWDGDWLDAGAIDSLLSSQSRLLANLSPTQVASTESEISGIVAAADDARVIRSRLRGPILIGDMAKIEDCQLGPEVVVGEGAQLRAVRLRRAIVAPGAQIEDIDETDVVVTSTGEVGEITTT